MKFLFQHLDNGMIGSIRRARNRFEDPVVIIPYDFVPEMGKKYNCRIEASSATLIYRGITYAIFNAILENKGSFVDVLEYKDRKNQFEKTTLQLAFEKAGV